MDEQSLGLQFPRALVMLAKHVGIYERMHPKDAETKIINELLFQCTEALAHQDTVKMLELWKEIRPFIVWYDTFFANQPPYADEN